LARKQFDSHAISPLHRHVESELSLLYHHRVFSPLK
jgi:hypothetical protein